MTPGSTPVWPKAPSPEVSDPPRDQPRPVFFIFSPGSSRGPGQKLAWLLFVITSVQAAFYWPPLVFVPGEKTRLSTAVFCGLSLAVALLTRSKGKPRAGAAEILFSLALTCLGLAGVFFSAAPLTSFFRTGTLLFSGLGGYWCSRLLLQDPVRQKSFINLGIMILAGFTALRLAQHFLAWPHGLVPSIKHATAGLIYILFFAPLSLVLGGNEKRAVLGLALMGSGWLLSILMYLKTAMALPLVMALLAFFRKHLRPLHLGLVVLALAGLAVILPHFYTQARIAQDIESVYYRAECYPFSWHMAKQNPILGNGLLAPRQEYLNGYRISFKPMGDGVFEKYLSKIGVSENIVLTFMADLGFPFTLIYLMALVFIMAGFLRKSPLPKQRSVIRPLVLALPLAAWAVHSMVFDSLLHPQICWFVHILLGLAVSSQTAQTSSLSIRS